MVIVEILNPVEVGAMAPYEPFIYKILVDGYTLPYFWRETFGFPDESRTGGKTVVTEVIQGTDTSYSKVTTLANLRLTAAAWYYNESTQELYIHLNHDVSPLTESFSYSSILGFSDNRFIYIDDQEYNPLITSIPSIAQQQDIVNYTKPAYMSGSIVMSNNEDLDDIFDLDLIGDTVKMYYLDDSLAYSPDTADRDDLIPLAEYFLEDVIQTQPKTTFKVQDKRKAENKTIPDTFLSGESQPIPILIGEVREAPAIPVNDTIMSGNVDFVVCTKLTALGSVYVSIEDVWTAVTPSSVNLDTGEFTLLEADGRESSGSIRDCKVVNPVGHEITYTSDIIKILNDLYLGISYTSTFYNITEWEAEEVNLSGGGILIDSETKISKVIYQVTNGGLAGFRYEIQSDGRRSIRIDDNSRAVTGFIDNADIFNRGVMPVSTNSKLQFATATVKYAKSYQSGRYYREKNSTYELSINSRNKNLSDYSADTLLLEEADAIVRASNDAERFKAIPLYADLTLTGADYLALQLLKIYDLTLIPGFADIDNDTYIGRQYMGFRKGKVIKINPDPRTLKSKVRFQLV